MGELVSSSPDEVDALVAEFASIVTDAFKARQSLVEVAVQDTPTMSPEDLHQRLLTSRQVVDVLEFNLVKALMAKSRADRLKAQRSADVEDAEIAISPDSTQDFSYLSARQRDIDLNGKTIAVRRALRPAARAASDGYFVVESLRTMLRGADSYRREIETRLRAITLTTSLER